MLSQAEAPEKGRSRAVFFGPSAARQQQPLQALPPRPHRSLKYRPAVSITSLPSSQSNSINPSYPSRLVLAPSDIMRGEVGLTPVPLASPAVSTALVTADMPRSCISTSDRLAPSSETPPGSCTC